MSVLKGFSWLEVCFYTQNGLILKTFKEVNDHKYGTKVSTVKESCRPVIPCHFLLIIINHSTRITLKVKFY